MDEPSWIMTVKGVKSAAREEENHREKPQRVAQNGSAPAIISENNHTRAHTQRNERNDHKDKTPSVSVSFLTVLNFQTLMVVLLVLLCSINEI